MRKTRQHLKLISMLLIFLMTLPGCSVYYSETASVDEAIQSNNKLKIKTFTNDIYKFEKLQKENDQIYGVTRKKSSTAKKLSDQVVSTDTDNKFIKISLAETTINEIYLKNKTASTVVSIAVPVVVVGVIFGIGAFAVSTISL